jgi:hypothetical protein
MSPPAGKAADGPSVLVCTTGDGPTGKRDPVRLSAGGFLRVTRYPPAKRP